MAKGKHTEQTFEEAIEFGGLVKGYMLKKVYDRLSR